MDLLPGAGHMPNMHCIIIYIEIIKKYVKYQINLQF